MNLKIFIKIKNLFIILKKVRFILKNPEKKKIIIFEKDSLKSLAPLCEKYNYFVLKSRYYQIDEIYLSLEIFFFIIKNFFKSNLSSLYLSALIKKINPKLILTSIDNSPHFSNVAKLMKNDFKFLAIQCAARYDIKQFSRKFFLPEFFCFGEYEKDLYTEYKSVVGKFNYCGSLNQAYFLKSKYFSKNKNNLYDIALVSEPSPGWSKIFPNFEENIGRLALFTLRLAKKYNFKVIFVGKRKKNTELFRLEKLFYRKYLGSEFFIEPKNEEIFSNYANTYNSKIIIGTVSTLLRENLGAGKKILSCNFSGDSKHDFPIDGMCNLRESNYEIFEKRVLQILRVTEKEYFDSLSKNKNYVMKFDEKNNAYNLIQERIDQILNKST